MKKKFVLRSFAALLAITVTLTAFVGCGKKKADPTDSDKTGTTQETTKETTKEDTKPAEKVDLGGYEFIFASHWITQFFAEEGADAKTDKLLEVYKQIETELNCKITPLSIAQENVIPDITQAVMAGDKYADIVDLNVNWFHPLRAANALAPLNDVKELDIDSPDWLPLFKALSTYNGKIYGVSYASDAQPPELRTCMFFNKTLLEKEGQPNIYDLVDKGEWTWDKFREIAKAVTKDTNGDGENDIWGVNTIGLLAAPFIFSNGGSIVKEEGGKYSYTLNSSEAQAALQFVHDLKNVDKVFKNPAEGGDWTTPSIEFTKGNIAFHVMEYWAAPVWFSKDMKDDYGIIPLPKGPNATDYVGHFADGRFFSMTATNKDKDKSAIVFKKLVELTKSDAWQDLIKTQYLRDDKSMDNILMMMNKAVADPSRATPIWGPSIEPILGAIESGSKTPKAGTDEIAGEAQAALDEFFKQK